MAKVKSHPDRKFKPGYYVEAYKLAKEGLPDHEIAAALSVTGKTFRRWKRVRSAFLDALKQGRGTRPDDGGLEEYLYGRLSPDLKELFQEIWQFRKRDGGVEEVRKLLEDKGVKVRQHLFLHALVKTQFDESRALKLVCVPKRMYDYWKDKDPEFEALVKEMTWHHQNWIINHANAAVRGGSESILLHLLKTKCKDRGYGEKTEVQVDHTHVHAVGIMDFDQLAPFLKQETKRDLLAAMEKARKALPAHVEDAEFTIKE